MKKQKIDRFSRIAVAWLTVIAIFLTASFKVMAEGEAADGRTPEYASFEELNGKTISMLTGAPFESLISSKISDVKEYAYYSSPSELLMALRTGKTDAFLNNTAIADLYVNQYDDVAHFPEPLKEAVFGLGFSKKYKNIAAWETALTEIPAENIGAVWNKWTSADESKKIMPKQTWKGKAGTIRIAMGDSMQPAAYINAAGDVLGFEPEIILMMAEKLDYKVEFVPMEFAALIASVESGKADACAGSLVITEERQKVLHFLPYHETAFVLIVRAKNASGEGYSLFGGFTDKLRDTLITDGRYKLILSGMGTTVLISLLSGVLGLLAAFGMVSLKRMKRRWVSRLIAVYCRVIAGLPVVVILMLLYYVVFGSSAVSSTLVAVIGFTVIFAPKAYALIANAVDAIDRGQMEGALALGSPKRERFAGLFFRRREKSIFRCSKHSFPC